MTRAHIKRARHANAEASHTLATSDVAADGTEHVQRAEKVKRVGKSREEEVNEALYEHVNEALHAHVNESLHAQGMENATSALGHSSVHDTVLERYEGLVNNEVAMSSTNKQRSKPPESANKHLVTNLFSLSFHILVLF